MKRLLSLLLPLLLILSARGFAQDLSLFDLDTTAFPIMKGKLYAFDATGTQVEPGTTELLLREDGTPRTVLSITCPPPAPPRALSSVLVMDVSGSMAYGPGATPNIDLARAAARAWVDALPFSSSECALTSFDHLNYLNQDFTTNPVLLQSAITALVPQGATDYDMGLLQPMAGGLRVAQRGRYQKVVVFLTDGLPNTQPDVAAIIAEAQRQNCLVYAVTLNMTCPSSLRQIAESTGGGWFENVTSVAEAEAIYRKILWQAQSPGPCEITWQSVGCPSGQRLVTLDWNTLTASSSYTVPTWKEVALDFSPITLFYRSKAPGQRYDTTITVSARNADFTVSNILSSNPAFDINPKNFSLTAGASRTLTVSFTPIDSGFAWTAFTFESDLCSQYDYASGGFPGIPPTAQKLKLEHPNGGEVFLAGSDTVIRWSGVPPTDTVSLEYSIDNGVTWTTVTTSATGGSSPWHVPNVSSNQCLGRVKHVPGGSGQGDLLHTMRGHTGPAHRVRWSPNGKRVLSAGDDGKAYIWDLYSGQPVAILDGHGGQPVYAAEWSPDGSTIVTVSADGTGKIWDASTGLELRTLTGHTGSVGCAVWSPDGSMIATASADKTVKVWNPTTGAVRHSFPTTGVVSVLDWDVDNVHLAGTSSDSTLYIWEMTGGTELHRMHSDDHSYTDIDWNPDGVRLATAGGIIGWTGFGAIEIIDGITGSGLLNGGHPGAAVTKVRWDPTGTFLLSGDETGVVQIIDFTTGMGGSLTLHEGGGPITSIEWSPDGTAFAVGSADNTVSVWDVATGTQLKHLRGHTGDITSVAWSPNGRFLATGSEAPDLSVRIWGILDNGQEDVSDALFSIVQPDFASFNVDLGKVQVLSIKDSTISGYLTNTGAYPVRIDSIRITGANASQFALVSGLPPYEIVPGKSHPVEFSFRPTSVGVKSVSVTIYSQLGTTRQTLRGEGVASDLEVIGEVIDFGQIAVGSSRDTLRAVTVRNAGSAPLTITGTAHAGPNALDFTTIAGGGAFTLQPGDTARLDLRFTASAPGRTSGRVLFDYNGPGSPAVVQLFGEGVTGLPQPLVINSTIDFGQVAVGTNRDTLQAVTIANIGTAPLNVTGTGHAGPNSPSFSTLAGGGIFSLAPGDTARLDLRFSPSAVGPAQDTLLFSYEGGSAPVPVLLIGTGVDLSSTASATVAAPELSAYPGDTVTLPLLLPSATNIPASGTTTFSVRLRFNTTLLEPIAGTPAGTVQGGERIIDLQLPLQADSAGVLARLLFRAGLGDDTTTQLLLESPQALDGSATLSAEPGTFHLLGVCYAGGARLLNPNGAIALKVVVANPVTDGVLSVELETLETGRTSLDLLDMKGEVVAHFVDENLAPGRRQLDLDINEVSGGLYMLRLLTPSQNRSLFVVVRR